MASTAIYEKENKKIINRFKFSELFWLFMVGSVAGFFIEGIWSVVKKGKWINHSATLWGPFCIVYGIGLIAVYVIAVLMEDKKPFLQFLLFAVSGSAVEFFSSVFQEVCFGSTSWNYSKYSFNIGGRISLRMTLIWGVMGLLFKWLLIPPIRRMFEKMRGRVWQIICIALTVFMSANLIVTSIAVLRWKDRLSDIPATNFVERILDDRYDNDAMKKVFSNLVFK